VKMLDNSATSLVFEEADNAYMTFVTTNSSEAINFDVDLLATSSTASKPVLTLKNTNNGATSAYLKFINDKGAAGADNDVCGTITFYGDDDNQDNIEFARIEGVVADASNGDECGALKLYVAENDGNNTVGLSLTGSTTDGEVDATIGAGSASVVTVPGHIDLAGDINVAGELQTANIGYTDGDNAITIADGGGVTFPQAATFTSGFSNNDQNITNVGDIAVDTVSGDNDSNTTIGFPGSDVLTLNTDGSERIRCDANGTLGIGTSSPGYALEVDGDAGNAFVSRISNSNTTAPAILWLLFKDQTPDTTASPFLQCGDNSANRLFIYSDGDVQNHDNSYSGISDIKLKQDVEDARDYWDDFKQIRFRKFKFKSDVEAYGADAGSRLGVVAQEAESVFPSLVTEAPDDLGTTTKGFKYSILNQIGLKVVQELQARLEAAEAKIAALEAA